MAATVIPKHNHLFSMNFELKYAIVVHCGELKEASIFRNILSRKWSTIYGAVYWSRCGQSTMVYAMITYAEEFTGFSRVTSHDCDLEFTVTRALVFLRASVLVPSGVNASLEILSPWVGMDGLMAREDIINRNPPEIALLMVPKPYSGGPSHESHHLSPSVASVLSSLPLPRHFKSSDKM
ncbi:hypothetical protein BDZ97DRAFT_2001710 [Flammula alnicola]|nr:hypothetical protein BDZ97DRAFT_2001710 [Flammula alnicola]